MNETQSDSIRKTHNQRIMAGCGLLLLALFFVAAFGLFWLIGHDRQQAQYPGSLPISAHSNYSRLPRTYRWDDTFRTNDEFTAVYNWYSTTFDMGAESRAIGSCILLETENEFLRAQRFMSVFICGTAEGQLVFVSRTTTFRAMR